EVEHRLHALQPGDGIPAVAVGRPERAGELWIWLRSQPVMSARPLKSASGNANALASTPGCRLKASDRAAYVLSPRSTARLRSNRSSKPNTFGVETAAVMSADSSLSRRSTSAVRLNSAKN